MAAQPTTLFIGVQYLRDNTIINDNVDSQVLQPIIRNAQYKYVQQVLGTALYNKVIAEIAAGTLAGDYLTLVDEYIVPVLTQYCILEALPYMTFKFRNKSISKQSSDYSTPAELQDLYYLRDNISSTASFCAERLTTYLRKNNSLYPELSTCEDLAPSANTYFSGIYIPKRGRFNDFYRRRGYDDYNY